MPLLRDIGPGVLYPVLHRGLLNQVHEVVISVLGIALDTDLGIVLRYRCLEFRQVLLDVDLPQDTGLGHLQVFQALVGVLLQERFVLVPSHQARSVAGHLQDTGLSLVQKVVHLFLSIVPVDELRFLVHLDIALVVLHPLSRVLLQSGMVLLFLLQPLLRSQQLEYLLDVALARQTLVHTMENLPSRVLHLGIVLKDLKMGSVLLLVFLVAHLLLDTDPEILLLGHLFLNLLNQGLSTEPLLPDIVLGIQSLEILQLLVQQVAAQCLDIVLENQLQQCLELRCLSLFLRGILRLSRVLQLQGVEHLHPHSHLESCHQLADLLGRTHLVVEFYHLLLVQSLFGRTLRPSHLRTPDRLDTALVFLVPQRSILLDIVQLV